MTRNSYQMNVCWHIYDLKASYKEYSAIYVFVLNICKIFGNGTKVSRVMVQEYLGMDMNWSQDGTMIVSMIKYLQKIIDDFPVLPPHMHQNTCLRDETIRTGNCFLRSMHNTSITL